MILGTERPPFAFREEDANRQIVGNLVDAYGSPARGELVEAPNAKGLARISFQASCSRCGGAGGADKWDHTGWTCFECGGTGKGSIVTARAYTPEAFAKLQARRDKLAAKRAAAAAKAEDERRAPYLAWAAANAHVLSEIDRLGKKQGPGDTETLADRIEHNSNHSNISPDWMVDGAVLSILRAGVQQDVKAASGHVGAVGERVTITVTCEKLLDYSRSGFPTVYFYIALMRDEAGNRIVYKGANPPLAEKETGKFKATVKEHDERDGEKQTILQRFKALDAEPAFDQWGKEVRS